MNKHGIVVAILNESQLVVKFLVSGAAEQFVAHSRFTAFEEIPLSTDSARLVGLATVHIPKGTLELLAIQQDPQFALLGGYQELVERTVRKRPSIWSALSPSGAYQQEETVVAREWQQPSLATNEQLGVIVGPIKIGDFVSAEQSDDL